VRPAVDEEQRQSETAALLYRNLRPLYEVTVFDVSRGFSSDSSVTAVLRCRAAATAMTASISMPVLPKSRDRTLLPAQACVVIIQPTALYHCHHHRCRLCEMQLRSPPPIRTSLCPTHTRLGLQTMQRTNSCIMQICTSKYRAIANPPAFPSGFPLTFK
jgi:hypothetical protein